MITISQTHLLEMQQHGKEAYPEECCGALLGKVESSGAKTSLQTVRIENNWPEGEQGTKHRRFAVTAEDYLLLEKKAKDEKLTLLGFYHTHPDHPAKPSQTDLSYAWPFFSYIILSIKKGNPDQIFSYELSSGEEKSFIEEKMDIS